MESNVRPQFLLPGEVDGDGRSRTRAIKMHEFLMTGGVQTGYDNKGIMTYGPPITVDAGPVCPWHGEGCMAWTEIVEGRGEWTRLESELADLKADVAENGGTEEQAKQITEIADKLAYRPRGAKQLRERTPEEFAAEKAAYDAARKAKAPTAPTPRVYAAAGPKTGGNPWDKKELHAKADEVRKDWAKKSSQMPINVDYSTGEVLDVEVDSRDEAIQAFSSESMPDTIEIDGDEGEEGDE